jgi:hypothetical protein
MEEFAGEVLADDEVIQSFNAFKTQYEDERDYVCQMILPLMMLR